MWDLKVIDTSRPLYLAIAEALERDIQAGILKPCDILPTHRALAKTVGVTVSTVTRAYSVAEKRGLIAAIVGKGTHVAADACTKPEAFNAELDRTPIEMGVVRPLHMHDFDFREMVSQVLNQGKLHRYMGYSEPQGLAEHREVAAGWLRRFGLNARPDQVLITAGGQHALFSIFCSLFNTGDRIAVDMLTYPGIKAVARRLGLRLEGVVMDSEGIIPEELESLCNRNNIKGLYTVGRMQNPTNRVMSAKRKNMLAKIIRKRRLTLVENDVYAFLGGRSDQTLSALAPDNGIYISSLSKAFYGGLRIAFVAAPGELCTQIAQGVADSMLLASPFCAAIVCQSIRTGVADVIIERKKNELMQRVSVFRKKLRHHKHICTENSMAAWLKLPDYWTGRQFERMAAESGVRIYAAERFAVGSVAPPNCIRVSISGPPDVSSFTQDIDRLASLIDCRKSPSKTSSDSL